LHRRFTRRLRPIVLLFSFCLPVDLWLSEKGTDSVCAMRLVHNENNSHSKILKQLHLMGAVWKPSDLECTSVHLEKKYII
jgi:hypothetical protein